MTKEDKEKNEQLRRVAKVLRVWTALLKEDNND
jgi:hypothetical protein